MVAGSFRPQHGDILRFYAVVSWLIAVLALVGLAFGWVYFTRRVRVGLPSGAES